MKIGQEVGMKKVCALLVTIFVSLNALAIDKASLDKFSKYDASSEFIILYDDLDALLKASVLFVGKSTRQKGSRSKAKTGTRLKNKIKPLTTLEGNRFFYKEFSKPEGLTFIENVRKSLEQLPSESPLALFKKEEQLAYWLNLYTITLIEKLAKRYPRVDMEDLIDDNEDDFFDQKTLQVDGVKLSLNDIKQITIHNFGHDPLLLYGFHLGNIASPDIKTKAYRGKGIWRDLEKNAELFINSNRGTFADGKDTFRVSYLYEMNEDFFKDFKKDLKEHLARYLLRSYKEKLMSAKKIRTNIKDWQVADIYGSKREYGGSIASNPAALLGAFVSESDGENNVSLTNTGFMDGNISQFSPIQRHLSSEHLDQLQKLLKNREVRTGNVSISGEGTIEDRENQ